MKPYWRGLVIPHSAISFKARRCLKRSVPISFRTAPSRRTNSSSPNPARAFSLGIGGTCFLAGRGSASTLHRSNGLQANTLRCAGTNPYRGHCRKNRTHAHRAFPLKNTRETASLRSCLVQQVCYHSLLALLKIGFFLFRLTAQHAVGSACRRP